MIDSYTVGITYACTTTTSIIDEMLNQTRLRQFFTKKPTFPIQHFVKQLHVIMGERSLFDRFKIAESYFKSHGYLVW